MKFKITLGMFTPKISIRISLLLTTMIFAALLLIFSGKALNNALQKKESIEIASNRNTAILLLFNTAEVLASERNATNIALTEPSVISNDNLIGLKKFQAKVDESLLIALQAISLINTKEIAPLRDNLTVSYEYLRTTLRKTVGDTLSLPKKYRDKSIIKQWDNALTNMLFTSQKLWLALAEGVIAIDPDLGRQFNLKHFTWIMSEYANRERSILSAIIGLQAKEILGEVNATKFAIKWSEFERLLRYRGNLEQAWETLYRLSKTSREEVKTSVAKVDTIFMNGEFEKLRKSVYRTNRDGENFPITGKKWEELATIAITPIYTLQDSLSKEIERYILELREKNLFTLLFNSILFSICFALVCYNFWVIIVKVIGPLLRISKVISSLANNNLGVEIFETRQHDEIEKIALSIQSLKDNVINKIALEKKQKRFEEQVKIEKIKAKEKLAVSFEESVKRIIKSTSDSVITLTDVTKSMNQSVNQSLIMSESALDGATKSSNNISSVASDAEKMYISAMEITEQISNTNALMKDSVRKVHEANVHAQSLEGASNKVEEVIKIISKISGQINLLALNATIEAARAGDAGMGFAVVAGEVKNLASQTDDSTKEIANVIGKMKEASDKILNGLSNIEKSVAETSDASASMASVIELQSITTANISQSIQTASEGSRKASESLEEVKKASYSTKEAASKVSESEATLSKQINNLDQEVTNFLTIIRED